MTFTGWWRPDVIIDLLRKMFQDLSAPNTKFKRATFPPATATTHLSARQLGSVNLKSCEQPQPASAMFSVTRRRQWIIGTEPRSVTDCCTCQARFLNLGRMGKPWSTRLCGRVLILKTGHQGALLQCAASLPSLHPNLTNISCMGCLQARQAPEGSSCVEETRGYQYSLAHS